MKCTKCHKEMIRKQDKTTNYWYYECPQCMKTIGKPEIKTEVKNDSDK